MYSISSNQLIQENKILLLKSIKNMNTNFLILFYVTEKSLKFLVTIQNIVMNKSIVHRDNIRKWPPALAPRLRTMHKAHSRLKYSCNDTDKFYCHSSTDCISYGYVITIIVRPCFIFFKRLKKHLSSFSPLIRKFSKTLFL